MVLRSKTPQCPNPLNRSRYSVLLRGEGALGSLPICTETWPAKEPAALHLGLSQVAPPVGLSVRCPG